MADGSISSATSSSSSRRVRFSRTFMAASSSPGSISLRASWRPTFRPCRHRSPAFRSSAPPGPLRGSWARSSSGWARPESGSSSSRSSFFRSSASHSEFARPSFFRSGSRVRPRWPPRRRPARMSPSGRTSAASFSGWPRPSSSRSPGSRSDGWTREYRKRSHGPSTRPSFAPEMPAASETLRRRAREIAMVLREQPGNLDALRLAFDVALDAGRAEEAIGVADRLLALYVRQGEAQLARALVFDAMNRARDAFTPRFGLAGGAVSRERGRNPRRPQPR